MSAEDRAKTKQIIVDQCVQGVDFQFIIHFSRVKAKMHDKLLQARENLAAKTNEAAETTLAHANNAILNINNTMMNNNFINSRYITKTPKINSLQHSLQIQTQHQSREGKIRDGIQLLDERMRHMKLQQIIMEDDGNCQFRSIAHQLYGSAEQGNHQRTRELCVTYLMENSNQFQCYFDGELEWQRYLSTMLLDGTWGDELTLKAASNVFHCNVHVLTSEKEHYYMCYVSDTNTKNNNTNDNAESKSNDNASSHYCDDIFLAYISPIHYNSIQLVAVQ